MLYIFHFTFLFLVLGLDRTTLEDHRHMVHDVQNVDEYTYWWSMLDHVGTATSSIRERSDFIGNTMYARNVGLPTTVYPHYPFTIEFPDSGSSEPDVRYE
jgi:hypothetical protein